VKQLRQVIVEKDNYGHTEHFAPVRLDRALEPGTLVTVETLSVGDGHLNARVAA
jgi:threonylcarbamoyladenosine tRNA methylthiotransferase MtaB